LLRQEHDLDLVEYTVIDLQGKKILSSRISSKETKIDVSDLASGIYFIKINEQVQKFVVE